MKELLANIGKEGHIYAGGLTINVKVLDVKTSYGNLRYLVTPLSGSNEVWVNDSSLHFKKEN